MRSARWAARTVLIRPAWGAREPRQSGVSRADFLHLDKDMPGNTILGPLPWKPCAAGMTLCFDGPSSITLTQHPLTGPRRGTKVASTRELPPGPRALRSETLKGLHKWREAGSARASSPTAQWGPAKWAPYASDRNTPHSREPRLNRSDDSQNPQLF